MLRNLDNRVNKVRIAVLKRLKDILRKMISNRLSSNKSKGTWSRGEITIFKMHNNQVKMQHLPREATGNGKALR